MSRRILHPELDYPLGKQEVEILAMPIRLRQVVAFDDERAENSFNNLLAISTNKWVETVAGIKDLDEKRGALAWAQYTGLLPTPGWRVQVYSWGAHTRLPDGEKLSLGPAHLLIAGSPAEFADATVALVLREGVTVPLGIPIDLYFALPMEEPPYSLYFGEVELLSVSLTPDKRHKRIVLSIDNTDFIVSWARAQLTGEEPP